MSELVRPSVAVAVCALLGSSALLAQSTRGLQSRDLYSLRSVGEVAISPDGQRIAYSLQRSDRPGRPYSQVHVLDVASGRQTPLGGDGSGASSPRWAPDGRRIAYFGRQGSTSGLMVAAPDGSAGTLVMPILGTNHPLPSSGDRIGWSPDGRQLAVVSATPGPETADATGDPMVITRYLYKPTASEGETRFNDNRRLHVFVVDTATKVVRQLTDGRYYEHSIDWSPDGERIAFISNREPDPDRFFNNDIFTVRVADGTIQQLTSTPNAEYSPSWSPDGRSIAYLGTERPLTSSETTMEDTHVWVIGADGTGRRVVAGAIDDRQGPPSWSADGRWLYFTVQRRGSVHLDRLPATGGTPEAVVRQAGSVGSWSLASTGALAYALATPAAPADLFLRASGAAGSDRRLSEVNADLLGGIDVAPVESIRFPSFDGTEVEAFLTMPRRTAGSKHPLIVMIHGGPHGQQGPSFNAKAQIFAARGWAALMVNFRGSTGYGQKFADAIFGDQNGGEARDVLAGVDAALARYDWLDASQMGVEGGSYGGQLANWLVTKTNRFKAAIPLASIANLVSFNYMAYYHDYLAVEFGSYPHENGLMDLLWERSPLRYVANVRTPVMLVHGENDNDVPIAEAEQFFIALKDVGVETVMIRYPREGHGIRETGHVVDLTDRSIAWYEKHFRSPAATSEPGGNGEPAGPRQTQEDDYTRYELLGPDSAEFRILYDVTATTPGARYYFNTIRKGSVARDESVVDLATGRTLRFEIVPGSKARSDGHPTADPETEYIKVHLLRPVPQGGGVRIRIDKTYKDAKSYYRKGDRIVFDRSLGITRNAVVLPPGYELVSCNVPSQVLTGPDGRALVSFMHDGTRAAPLVIEARPVTAAPAVPKPAADPKTGVAASAALSVPERAFQDREIVYFLNPPETHSFSLYHDYTETREGMDRYLNIVRQGSTVSNPSASVLDTGETLETVTLEGEAITRARIDIGEPVRPESEVMIVKFPAVKRGESVRLRIEETYTDPGRYGLAGDELVWHRSLGRPRNAVVLPAGWFLTTSSVPAVVSETDDGRVRLDYLNPRTDSIDVLLKARRRR